MKWGGAIVAHMVENGIMVKVCTIPVILDADNREDALDMLAYQAAKSFPTREGWNHYQYNATSESGDTIRGGAEDIQP